MISSAPLKDPRAVRMVPRARFKGGRRPFMLCAAVQALPSLASPVASSRVTAPSDRVGLRERPCAYRAQERQQRDLPRLTTPTPGIGVRHRLKSPNLSEAPRRILALRPPIRARGSGQGPRRQRSEQVSGLATTSAWDRHRQTCATSTGQPRPVPAWQARRSQRGQAATTRDARVRFP